MKKVNYYFLLCMTLSLWGWQVTTSCVNANKNVAEPPEELPAKGEIPIKGWWGIPANESTPERFREMKEAGFTINFSPYDDIASVEKALDAAQEAGVKLMFSCPELKTEPEKTVARLMKHPALAGYHLVDEPSAASFPELGAWMKRIQAVDAEHDCYINLLPGSYAPPEALGTATYAEHVDAFIRDIPTAPFISFDHYPIVEENGIHAVRGGWYNDLEIVSAAARKAGIPFWAFALATAHKPYPIPTAGDIKLQMYSNLAYGAQALQYFTYWNPPADVWDFHHAPIDLNGNRTVTYDLIKQLNAEIQKTAGVFLGAKVIFVAHTGQQIPAGTRRLAQLPAQIKSLDTGNGGAVVSLLENDNRQFLVIVNRDNINPMQLTVVFDQKVKQVLDGRLVAVVPHTPYTLEYGVAAGDVVIFGWTMDNMDNQQLKDFKQ